MTAGQDDPGSIDAHQLRRVRVDGGWCFGGLWAYQEKLMLHVLGICGSLRKGSYNALLLRAYAAAT